MLKILREIIALKPMSPSVQSVRGRTFNTRKPRPPHFEFNQIQAGVKPKFARPYDAEFPVYLKCRKQFQKQLNPWQGETEENPYERILANEFKPYFDCAKMVLIVHSNSISLDNKRSLWIQFKKQNMEFTFRGKNLIRMCVENTKYESILRFYQPLVRTFIVISPEVNLDVAYSIFKKFPSIVLLAGIIENKFLRRHELDILSKLSSIDDIRAQLVCTMGTVATQFVQNLSHHQMMTLAYLDKYVEMQKSSEESSPVMKELPTENKE